MRDTKPLPRKPDCILLTVRCALSTIVIFSLAVAVACKRKDPRKQQTPAIASHSGPVDTSYLPQDIFGADAVPGATVLQPIDLRSLSDTETKYGIAPKRSSAVEYQPDVIVMEQGDKAIRSISGNGMEWEFDANAEHVRISGREDCFFTIAPLNSPNYQKNYNTGSRAGYENLNDARVANIKIFHDAERKSRLTLPLAAPAQKNTDH